MTMTKTKAIPYYTYVSLYNMGFDLVAEQPSGLSTPWYRFLMMMAITMIFLPLSIYFVYILYKKIWLGPLWTRLRHSGARLKMLGSCTDVSEPPPKSDKCFHFVGLFMIPLQAARPRRPRNGWRAHRHRCRRHLRHLTNRPILHLGS